MKDLYKRVNVLTYEIQMQNEMGNVGSV